MPASPSFPTLPPDWKEENLVFENKTMFLRIWSNPRPRTNRALYIVHGFGEQSDRYTHFPHYLHTSVDFIAAVDLPGHGRSMGRRGHCENIEEMTNAAINGLKAFEGWLAQKNQTPQIHWLGHSFGGLTTLKALAGRSDLKLKSMIVSAPQTALSMKVPWLKKLVGEMITPLFPKLHLSNEIVASSLSRDPSVGAEYIRNALNHSKITPRMFAVMKKGMADLQSWKGPLPFPALLILPLDDKIVDSRVTFRLWKNWTVENNGRKEISSWPANCHEAFNDLDKPQVFNALEAWLNK